MSKAEAGQKHISRENHYKDVPNLTAKKYRQRKELLEWCQALISCGHLSESIFVCQGKQETLVFYPEEPPNTKGYQTTVEVSLTEVCRTKHDKYFL